MNAEHARYLAEFSATNMESEFPATCKVIAAVPDDRRDYKPDGKSRTAWELATHLALSDLWFFECILDGTFHWDPAKEEARAREFSTIAQVVEYYQERFPLMLRRLRDLTPDEMTRTVDFFGMYQRPAVAFLGFHGNHTIHHRGQLCTYLRAMGSKVPPIYGDSADFPMR